VLHTSTDSLEALEYALDETELFSDEQRSLLPLAKRFTMDESADFLESARRWTKTSPSAASRLVQWVGATRSGDFEAQAQMIVDLSEQLGSAGLLTAVPALHLKKDARLAHRERLIEERKSCKANAKASLSWAIADQLDDEISEAHAGEMELLGYTLDESLQDPDAQSALLLSGYEHLAMQQYEEALDIFERLLEILPGDLTLCHGTSIAAAHADRPDLEAITCVELAKSTEDNVKSASLWERAGVLFQDALDDVDEAEKCFTAALARSPGSRVSFERIYQFARDRNDRQRQVELIDSRLDTAESESLLIDLYWEKARFCRMLGRRAIALRSLEELLALAPDHLPALALAAELHLVDGRIDAAAAALKSVAKHPDTPPAQRGAAGLHACDLFEQLRNPREAVELLQVLDEYGVSGSAGLERRARSLARSEDWGAAYNAFSDLNNEQDQIEARLESARMMLAIQRDHLKDPEELKRSARAILRDAPVDSDAIQIVLDQSFPPEERRRLLGPAREQSAALLRKAPLNPPEIQRFAGLCLECGEHYLERVALGNLGLTGKLPAEHSARLEALQEDCLPMPSQPLSKSDLEAVADPLQLGSPGRYIQLISPYLSEELDPSLDALGVSSLMRTDEFSGSPHRAEIGTWVGAFGDNDFELYVGGADATLIRGLHGDLPTLLVGKEVTVPLSPLDRARVVAQLSALHYDTVTFLNHSIDELEKWIIASEILAGRKSSPETAGEIDEMARRLSKRVPREVREELTTLRSELSRAGVVLSDAPYVLRRGAARAACLAYGDASVLRSLPELLPENQEMLNVAMADAIRFVLSDEFISMRRGLGLEGT
jgi:tetratricopeptide (TPR) repeat protein